MKTNNENKELNKDSNKDLTKKSKKESNSKKFKKIDFKELQRKSKEKRIQNKKNLKHGSYSMGAITIFIAIIVVLIAGSAVKIQRNRFKYTETLQHW